MREEIEELKTDIENTKTAVRKLFDYVEEMSRALARVEPNAPRLSAQQRANIKKLL